MKKCKRWIAVLLISVMCLSLCGCQDLEDMRAAHALLQEDGSIKWNGNVYRLMTISPEKTGILFADNNVWVTEKDVPVLLSEQFGQYARVSQNGVVLVMYGHDGETLYCREDQYNATMEYLQNAELTTYYYTYWDYDTGNEQYYYLSTLQGDVIDRAIVTSVFTAVEDEFYYSFGEDDFVVSLGKCDESRLFGEHYVVQIARKNGRFYLIAPDNFITEVDASYTDTMKRIVSVYYNEEVKPYL